VACHQHFVAQATFSRRANVVDIVVLEVFSSVLLPSTGYSVTPYRKRYAIGGTMFEDPGSFARADWNAEAIENSVAAMFGASTPANTLLFAVAFHAAYVAIVVVKEINQ
jgi:hypothetical protein